MSSSWMQGLRKMERWKLGQDGEKFARFLHAHAGEFGGVILCLPNFGDENGAVAALQQAGVPILIHAYPDRLDQMAPEIRRDAFCGKFSIMDVFCQNRIKFTAIKPHTVEPASLKFKETDRLFRPRLPRCGGELKTCGWPRSGRGPGAFKTVRIDELALQKYGISMETFDLSDILAQMAVVKETPLLEKAKKLEAISDWSAVPSRAREQLGPAGRGAGLRRRRISTRRHCHAMLAGAGTTGGNLTVRPPG